MRSLFLTALTLIASTLAQDVTFDGIGQLRTRLQEGDHSDIGCLTETGRWTGNDEKCGVFVATPVGNSLFNLTSITGDCYVYGAAFRCDGGEAAFQFGVSSFSLLFSGGYQTVQRMWNPVAVEKKHGRNESDDADSQQQEWPKDWPNGVPGVPVLRWGLYGLMASMERNAPGVAGAPQEVHMTSYSEPGKRFWLTWKPVK